MNNTSTQTSPNRFSFFIAALLGLFLMVGLVSCSSGGGSGDDDDDDDVVVVTPDQEASGLYKDGIANLNAGALMPTDLRGFVHDGRVIVFSATANLLFDGTVTAITGDEYTATVDVYEDGELTQPDVAVTGMVTSQSQISGTINGTGNASGTFSLTFDLLYDTGASDARIDTSATAMFAGPILNKISGATTNTFDTFMPPLYDMGVDLPNIKFCSAEGSYTIPDTSINIYILEHTITQLSMPECTMSETPVYTGFAAIVDGTATDDTLIYAITNGTDSEFAILTR